MPYALWVSKTEHMNYSNSNCPTPITLIIFHPVNLFKNRFKISGYCFLLIIPAIFTPLFLTRMNCFDHLNTLRSSLFFLSKCKCFHQKDFMGSTVLLLSLLSSWWYGRFCYFQLRKCVFLILLSFMLLRLMKLFTIHITTATGNNAVRIYYSTNNIYRIDSLT